MNAIETIHAAETTNRSRGRKLGRILKKYYVLPSKIRSIQLQIDQIESKALISNYDYDTVKAAGTKDPTARIAELKTELAFAKRELEIFDQFREVMPGPLIDIWEGLYNPKLGLNNNQLMLKLRIDRKMYYRSKNELLDLIEEAFQ
ncbi:hypothetical protein ACNOIU_15945 (plasmid) [Exiguobacterium mexicanum]|uniref:hypothetical protein n=1 Tax=Exiguobacterium mexicanum TaxID=340146 RepID=UPI003AB15FD3